MRLSIPLTLGHGGRTLSMDGLLDTGAEHFIVITDRMASKLGLTRGQATACYGVGDNIVCGWQTTIDRVSIAGQPQCTLDKVSAFIIPEITPGTDILIGEYFLRSVKAKIDLSEEGKPVLVCREGPHIPISSETVGREVAFAFFGAGAMMILLTLLIGEK